MESLKNLLAEPPKGQKSRITDDILRTQIVSYTKDFKVSWVKLGQALYTVWNDKMYKLWGYEKFEAYTEKEIGLKKQVAIKLLKSYYFLEHEEPVYLKEEFKEDVPAATLPGFEVINALRLAKNKKDLPREEFGKLKASVFEKGKDAVAIRKELTALMRQRKELDPDEEREKRNAAAIRRLLNAFRSFQRDMETLKLVPTNIVEEATQVMRKLAQEID